MVRLVDCHETDALAGGKFFRVVRQKLRRGQNDINIARGQPCKRNGTLLRRALTRKRDRRHTERQKRVVQMPRLVGNQRAQRIHENRCFPLLKRQFRRSHLERERFSAPRCHNGQQRLTLRQLIENLTLGIMQFRRANDGLDNAFLQLIGLFLSEAAPIGAILLQLTFVALNFFKRFVHGIFHAVFGRGIQVRHERHFFGRQARLKCRARTRRRHGFQHGLHRLAPTP